MPKLLSVAAEISYFLLWICCWVIYVTCSGLYSVFASDTYLKQSYENDYCYSHILYFYNSFHYISWEAVQTLAT